jgi:hypothetical protein
MSGEDESGVHLEQRRCVIVRNAVHRTDERNVVHHAADVREQFGHVHAALTVLLELPRRRQQATGMSLRHHNVAFTGHRFAGAALQFRLGVEGIHLADAAITEDRDHRLGLGGKVRQLRREGIDRRRGVTGLHHIRQG